LNKSKTFGKLEYSPALQVYDIQPTKATHGSSYCEPRTAVKQQQLLEPKQQANQLTR